MKALSIREPWISLIVEGKKTIEIRGWKTKYRGDILLVGSKATEGKYSGMAVAIAEIYDCQTMRKEHEEAACHDLYFRMYSWFLRNLRLIEPFPVEGKLGLYEVEIPEGK